MPLRDHFRPPVSTRRSWEEVHGQWPAVIVQYLHRVLPPEFDAGPRVHLGAYAEVDVCTDEYDPPAGYGPPPPPDDGTAWAAALPVVAVETELPDPDEYEVRVYGARRNRTLVAAIAIVSPANKDRPEHRNVFVGKCAALLRQGVAVSVVDLVTARQANLFADLLAFVGQPDLDAPGGRGWTYAASCRWLPRDRKARLETVSFGMALGQPLPTLPLWLGPDRPPVRLDLEATYEQTCRDLRLA